MNAVTWEPLESRSTHGVTRRLFELSHEVRFAGPRETCSNAEGAERTRFVVVSWGRDGDTGVFPSNERGEVLDWLGWSFGMGWQEHDDVLRRWAEGKNSGFDEAPIFTAAVSS